MKKGILLISNQTVVFIVLLLFLAGMFPIMKKIFDSRLDEDIINQQCKESVYQNSERRLPGVETESIPVKCPTKYITIHKEYTEQEYESDPFDRSGGSSAIKLSNIKYKECEADDEESCMFRAINKIFADEVARCWHVFHKGQRRVFSLYEEGKQCVVCSVLLFDNEMKEEYGDKGLIAFEYPEDENYNLDLYMRQNSNLRYTGDDNYYEYTLDLIDESFGLPYYGYDVNNDYAVVFVALNKQNVDILGEELWEWISGQSTEFEEGNYVNTLELIRNDEISTRCDVWG